MKSFVTSYVGLFGSREVADDTIVIEQVEIPLIQRDYAQGRATPAVAQIRADFLDVLCNALIGGRPAELDFVYGDVQHDTLRPLDGQQRLTTLFLLHWYVAFRTGRLSTEDAWTRFRYATRASAELFCERIVGHPPPPGVLSPSKWIADQEWYLHVWQHDPTIQAMLVMVDAIDERLKDEDLDAAWERLLNESAPAIAFHLLPIEEIGAGDELYIKMNSRGKPLTPFENFKARFEKALEASPRASDFAHRVDGEWADVLWRYRGDDDIIDDEFVRYFTFVTEIAEWRNSRLGSGRLESRAECTFGSDTVEGRANLDFLFEAFDAWVGIDIEEYFTTRIAAGGHARDSSVRFFGVKQVDLFKACCESYAFGRQRTFGWAETLTLYACLVERIHKTADFPRRLRVLRNLLESSANELRLENMPALVKAVDRLVRAPSLAEAVTSLGTFNEAQIEDERAKAEFLGEHPYLTEAMFALEDHRLLRGSLVAFDLDAQSFASRAICFAELMNDVKLWPTLTAALLAMGDYSRHPNTRSFRFGSPVEDRWWRELLTGSKRANLRGTTAVLGALLDAVSTNSAASGETLRAIRDSWLAAQNEFDWRYYFVKYDAMREGRSGIYVAEGGRMAFRLCMLDKTQLNSWYRDPYLLAIMRAAGATKSVRDPWFTGYETDARWMTLHKSGTRVRCVEAGFVLQPPPDTADRERYRAVCDARGIGDDNVLPVPRSGAAGPRRDAEDRVELGASLLADLIAAGL